MSGADSTLEHSVGTTIDLQREREREREREGGREGGRERDVKGERLDVGTM